MLRRVAYAGVRGVNVRLAPRSTYCKTPTHVSQLAQCVPYAMCAHERVRFTYVFHPSQRLPTPVSHLYTMQ